MLKLRLLVENNTYIDDYYLGEPALSYYIECDGKKILFDTGYSDVFIHNAKKMGIDLNNLDYVVLSHAHNDHTGGLAYLVKEYDLSNTVLVTHPFTLTKRYDNGLYVGAPIFVEELKKKFKDIVLTDQPYYLTDNLVYAGQIERTNTFENIKPIGYVLLGDKQVGDYNLEDSSLIYKDETGIDIITACSHCGICNIIETGKKLFNNNIVNLVIGGFHLFEDDAALEETIKYFLDNKIKDLYPCHCVSLICKHKMMNKLNVHEVGVGLELTL